MLIQLIVVIILFVFSWGEELQCTLKVNKIVKIENMNMTCIQLQLTQDSMYNRRMRYFKIVEKNIEIEYHINNETFNTNLSNNVCHEETTKLFGTRKLHLCGNIDKLAEISNIKIITDKMRMRKIGTNDIYSDCHIDQEFGVITKKSILFNNNCQHFYCSSLALGDGEDCLESNDNIDVSRLVKISPMKIVHVPSMKALCVEMVLVTKTRGIANIQVVSKEHMQYQLYQGGKTIQISPKERTCKDTSYRWNLQRRREMLCTFHGDNETFETGTIMLTGRYSISYATFSRFTKTATIALNKTWNTNEMVKNIQPSDLVCPPRCLQSCEPTCSTLIYGNGKVLCNGIWKSVQLDPSNFFDIVGPSSVSTTIKPKTVKQLSENNTPTTTFTRDITSTTTEAQIVVTTRPIELPEIIQTEKPITKQNGVQSTTNAQIVVTERPIELPEMIKTEKPTTKQTSAQSTTNAQIVVTERTHQN